MSEIQPIIEATRLATDLCRHVQENYLVSNEKVNHGKDAEPVTIADYGSQAIICRALAQHFPDDAVIAEEAGSQFLELVSAEQRAYVRNVLSAILEEDVTEEQIVNWLDHGTNHDSNRIWVIDPIDGTKGFVAMRHYAIAVGLVENGLPTDAVVSCPGYENSGAIFFARDGKACKQSMDGSVTEEIVVANRDNPTEIQIVQSFEKKHASKSRMARVRELAGLDDSSVRELDSMEKYTLVACGDADLYMRLPNLSSTRPHNTWDHAAGAAIVIAAGGKATDVDGSPLIFSEGAIMPNQGMIVSNGVIHDTLVTATQSLLAEEKTV